MKIFLLFLTVCSLTALAAEPVPGDFAAGFEISIDGNAAIYRVPLPAAVYTTTTRDSLGDVRVFNSANQIVPHAIRLRQEMTVTESVRNYVPYFPLPNELENSNDKLNITVRDDGAIVSINFNESTTDGTDNEIKRYILDLSGLKSNVDALEFTLFSNVDNFLKRVTLEASEDLNYWAPHIQHAALSSLKYAGYNLVQNRINLTGTKPKYLRFTWLDEIGQIKIMGVYATLDIRNTYRELTWSTVFGTSSQDQGRQVYDFDTGGAFPVEQVILRLPEDNSLIEATLKSRKNAKDNWRVRDSGLFYNLNMQGTHLEREPVPVGLTTDRYWRLEVNNSDGMGGDPPQMKFAWQANELYFLARGQGPFTLAYGNASVAAPAKPVDALMHVLSDDQQSGLITSATLGQPLTLKGKAALQPDRNIPWQRIILWSVLVTGVLITAIIALRLFKQLGKT